MNKYKIWGLSFLLYVCLLFLLIGSVTCVIDPYFHYHQPLDILSYPLSQPHYQNHGIVQHFTYDAMILGNSMTDNFRTSELDELFGVNSVKVSTKGASFHDLRITLETALAANPELKMVVMALDSWFMGEFMYGPTPTDNAPTFLYDRNPFNDVEYLLNKEVLFSNSLEVLSYTAQGNQTTSFDEYCNWRDMDFGKEVALANYTRSDKSPLDWAADDAYLAKLSAGLERELLDLTRKYPDVTFYFYFPPYSALFWDRSNQHSSLENDIIVLRELSAILFQEDNIRIFSFHDDFEVTTNLDFYRDDCHHTGEINSRILQCMHSGTHQITAENYIAYWERVLAFYQSYDFDAIFAP